jgi:hypothetical protein
MDNDTQRGEYVKGLRVLADLLETHPELPLPYTAGTEDSPAHRLTFYYLGADDPKARLAEFARLIPGTLRKEATDGRTLRMVGRLAGLWVQGVAEREAVCERVVTGTREVTRTVFGPAPVVGEVTETVEDVRWDCAPLLAVSP